MNTVIIVATHRDSVNNPFSDVPYTSYYTGRSGAGFVSSNRADAFDGFNRAGAEHRAATLNQMTAIHGYTFAAEPAPEMEPDAGHWVDGPGVDGPTYEYDAEAQAEMAREDGAF